MNNKEWLVFYMTCGDGYTYSFDKFIPFQYSSKKDAEDALLEYAYKFLELYLIGFNTDDWSEYFKWKKNNEFFNVYEFDCTDLWYFSGDSRNKILKLSDYNLSPFQIHTLQEWAEANEEKVKYLQKDV